MADDRFTWIHDRLTLPSLCAKPDPDDDMLDWSLPDDDIAVPAHLVPPFQDEDDETLLPSQTHPSYPYGNPYRFTSSSLVNSTTVHLATSHRPTHLNPHPFGSTRSAALPTSLASLELPDLFALTSFGDPSERVWREQNLYGLFGPKTKREEDDDAEERDRNVNTHGDAGPPAGQNAADGAEDGESGTESGDEGERATDATGSGNED